tara:strand:+ start:965 stop:1438 length:474 start_codon:yes stop_codon:yes gene_type:complete
MNYAKISEGYVVQYPYMKRDLLKDNLATSFPKELSPELMLEFGAEPVVIGERPEIDGRTQEISISEWPELVDDVWTILHTVMDKSEGKISEFDNLTASSNRAVRDELLTKSDWTQISDTPLDGDSKGGWAGYRVELRNLTDHMNWPNLNEEDWPMKP